MVFPMKSVEDLFHVLLQDVYFAEKQLLRSLAAFADASADGALQHAFATHRIETRDQIGRLEQVFEAIGRRPRGRHCDAILGIVAEADEVIDRTAAGSVRDTGILAAMQAAAHYEIARYATLVAWAERLDEHQAAQLLRQSLDEKRAADTLLGRIAAVSVNQAARAA